ncbi:UDP-N-acetylmuramoyl-L-alanyl-D-glutamate--2,6-diaminopimelate ligase [Paenibacillus oceani]|uniref:UDP-N-acetylmuramoyl-L-alanyl-D-glutamate--2,6-diaminopimelate ligase n=1 Tax=Paenibacillus oceani TaxID=2772510 RepID=A0A927C465_9BACL|nr:UDP-N-acetylmuramoyl-L-alanyl-D-glutamate--2,6-diaminopimelate ligase [Paenibacillus oceani]MBD2861013.1 UDP-N-acetylmuramoyl-L-alanyl-D-glutamate--2,6-diaminopimelate ligase [Paenibacillus oceani]
MKLNEMANLLTIARTSGNMETEISGFAMNSKQVRPGDLFICIPGIPGLQEDRHPYAEEAVRAGAAALIVEREVGLAVPTIQVPDARYAMAVMTAHFYGYPSSQLKVIGVTGTNGKTTTSHMIEAVLAYAGYRTGLMGNIGTKIGEVQHETDINTPESYKLQANLRKMADHQTDYCVMEATSQGLDMGRVIGCEFRTAVFTNLTLDHLDYHGTMERYREAKGLLFSRMGNAFSPDASKRKYAVLNIDDPASDYFRKQTTAQVVTYGIHGDADVTASNVRLTARGTEFELRSYTGTIQVQLQMVGKFNVYNALATAASCLVEGVPLEVIGEGLARIQGVAGRMEVVDEGQPFLVLADYAHTPDSLDNCLSTVREFAERRVITVFGCGGDRDRSKRPMMGGLAARYSDYIIVTSDNPRKEKPSAIMQDIEQGLKEAGIDASRYELIEDRKQAIGRAVELAGPGDIVLIAGKGHETYQIFKDGTVHFDDRAEARLAIRRKKDETPR